MTQERVVVQVITPDVQVFRSQVLGENNNLVTPYDAFKASNFASDVISGANNYTSGYNFLSGTLSNVVRIRDRKSTRLNSSHIQKSRMPSSA